MNIFQIIFVPLCAAVALLVVLRGMRERAALRTSLFWASLWTAAAVAIRFPASVGVTAAWLGIGRGADLVLYAAVLSGIAACLYFYQRYRRLEQLCTELTRREAIRHACRGTGLDVN